MRFFSFFNKNGSGKDSPRAFSGSTGTDYKEVPEKVFIENDVKVDETNSPQVDNNINLLFEFLDKNNESKGYDDALVNPDANHLNQNLEALRNELIRNINKVKTFYEDFIKEINYHIDSRSRSGMVDTVEELKMKKEIAESHAKKVLEIELSAHNDAGDSQGILISYARGFRNGLAAISHHAVLKRKL